AGQRFHRKLDDAPFARLTSDQSPAEIILVPPRHDDDLARTWFQARQEVVDVPLPGSLAGALTVGIFAATHRIIDNPEIGASPGDRTANTGRIIFSTRFSLPLTDRFPIGGDTDAEDVAVRL